MTGPAPAVARIRHAVRSSLTDLAPGDLVLAAVSGGRDSLALADALAFEGPRAGLRVGALVVDHGLQPDSAAVAAGVGRSLRERGYPLVEVLTVTVTGGDGPEAAARTARYAALERAAHTLRAVTVLLGHTLDDQAETVLLGLARGSGARSLSGMAPQRGIYRRPLLRVDRAATGAACGAAGLKPWDDPQNVSTAFTRVRTRLTVLPVLESELGPGIAAALARSADQLRDDDAALEEWAATVTSAAAHSGASGTDPEAWECATLQTVPAAVRRRAIRRAAIAYGVDTHALRQSQLAAIDALIVDWHGQGPVDLPGGVQAHRRCGRLTFVAADGTEPRPSSRVTPKE